MKKYILYEVKIINDIPMLDYMMEISAKNIIEAEHKSEPHQQDGKEYLLTMLG